VKLDLIETNGEVAINECAMGLDSEICIRQISYKKLPGVNGELAYTLAALGCIAKGKTKNQFKITIDDNEVFEDDYLFCYIGNSRWYGGGYKAAPNAMPNDGFIDCVMVRSDRSPIKLLPLISVYKNGEHLDLDITTFRRCKKVRVESRNPAAVNVDGECAYVTEREFKLLEKAITFVVPRGSEFLNM
jgi:diacylglycerol kinase family enzyme